MRMISVLFLLWAAAAGAADRWTPEVSMKVQRIADVTPSPDGKMAAWTQTRAVIETEKSENVTQIFIRRPGSTQPIQLTRGEKSAQDPSFSPDGRFVFFISDRSGKKNLYRIPLDGGEAEILTDWKGAIASYRVAPDGKSIAFAGAEPDPEDEKAIKEKRDIKIIDDKPHNHVLYVIPIEPDAAGKRASRKVASGNFHVGEFRWSPDSRFVVFEHRPRPEFDFGRHSDLSQVEIENATVTAVATGSATEAQPRYSPDGRYLAFVKSHDQPSGLRGSRVALLDRQSKAVRLLAVTPDERPQLLDWAADSSKVYVSEPSRTRAAVFALPMDGPRINVYLPAKGLIRPGAEFSKDGLYAGATMESANEPPEAFLFDLQTQKAVKLSEANVALAKMPLGETKLMKWKSRDGVEVEGLLTVPVGNEQGKRYPLVLIIHGGPASAFTEAFIGASGVQSIASFAAKGYAVLRVNPRGSVGYGLKFTAANEKDWGGGDYQDIMAGVDKLIADGIADSAHMAVMGWSYGGYMTSWVISQTTRFQAAIVGAGITNVWSMWGTNDIPSVLDDYFSGPPWQNPELYLKRSGLFYAKQVKTPTLFLHGEEDFRVPIGQAFEYYHALKRLGVTTKMVAYPRTPHGPSEPKFVLDVMQRHLDWTEKYAR